MSGGNVGDFLVNQMPMTQSKEFKIILMTSGWLVRDFFHQWAMIICDPSMEIIIVC